MSNENYLSDDWDDEFTEVMPRVKMRKHKDSEMGEDNNPRALSSRKKKKGSRMRDIEDRFERRKVSKEVNWSYDY